MTKKILAGLALFGLIGLMASTTINGVRIIAGDLTVQGTTTLANGAALGSPASIVLPSGATGTTQSALDNSTKIATTAYVDTSRGMKGSAIFSATGGTIAGLVTSGIITNVTRNSAGNFTVTLSSPPSNTLIFADSSDSNTGHVSCYAPGGTTSTTLPNPFLLICTRLTGGGSPTGQDPSFVMVGAFAY